MIDPLLALLVAVVFGAVLVVLFWPGWGLLRRLGTAFRASDRMRIEDALKHFHDCEYHGQPCTLQSLSGALGISGNRGAELLRRLEHLQLVVSAATGYALTTEGRSYALRVVRIHRLWERYLAERTGVAASEWHARAETVEHKITAEEADSLAASMGHPRYDPHGDPIPTASGEIGPLLGRPLTELAPGSLAEIVHVEDEPDAVYAQLLAAGLHPGLRIRILESSPQRIRFEVDAEEHVLAPVFAANVSVVDLVEAPPTGGPIRRLSDLELGRAARVIGISNACRGAERRRLLDLGVIPGSVVRAEMRSPAGDPVAYRIRGAVIALRAEQAGLIRIEQVEERVP
jgi:DtxR family Mn-dependent transcriptional regulator